MQSPSRSAAPGQQYHTSPRDWQAHEPAGQDTPSHLRGRQAGTSSSGGTAAPAPPVEDSHALWRHFAWLRVRQRMRGDKLAAAVMIAVAVAARLGSGQHPTALEELHSGSVLALSIAVMLSADEVAEHGMTKVRGVLVLGLKLAVATAPLFRAYSLKLLEGQPGASQPEAQQAATALLRVLMADHTALLLFLGTAMPLGLLLDMLVQLLFLISLAGTTVHLCNTPQLKKTNRRGLINFVTNEPACIMFIGGMQVTVGVMLPLFLSIRREAAAAVQFGEDEGMPPSNRQLRVCAWLLRATNLGDPLGWRVGTVMVALYAAVAWLAWAYLGVQFD